MAVNHRRLSGLVQLFRIKPTLSWGVSAFLLGAAVAFARTGGSMHLLDGAIAVVGVLAAQGVAAHGLNDAYDWVTGTDKESIGKGTGGSRVIPEGKMTVLGAVLYGLSGLVAVILVAIYMYLRHGTPILVLGALAVYAPVAYSLPPLKLGYRPFAELTVAVPAITGVAVGADLVLAGSLSWAALFAGLTQALFCAAWFVVSRLPDYEPDRDVGKITTAVFVGRELSPHVSFAYVMLGLAAAFQLTDLLGYYPIITTVAALLLIHALTTLDPADPLSASDVRLRMMTVTTAHGVFLALAIAFEVVV